MRFLLGGKKRMAALVILVLIAGLVWWQRSPLLAWYYVSRLAGVLQAQGLNEGGARFAYRAQKLQRLVLLKQRKLGQYLFSLFLDVHEPTSKVELNRT